MFNRRLKILLLFVVLFNGVLIGRLVYLQVYKYDYFVAETEKLLKRSPRWLETARGSIRDRNGEVLAHDVPEWRVCLHYNLTRLYDVRFYRYFVLRYLRREENANATDDDVVRYFMDDVEYGYQRGVADQMIKELAEISGATVKEIRAEIDRINEEIFSMRLWLARKKWYSTNNIERPATTSKEEYYADYERIIPDEYERLRRIYYYTEIREMVVPQKVLEPISREQAMQIEEHFNSDFLSDSRSRLITISADRYRRYPHGEAAPHIVGQVARTRDEFERLSFGGATPLPNELTAYRPGDRWGMWGVERMFESQLHGSRGWQQQDIEGDIIQKIDQKVGEDVSITLDIGLQEAVQKVLAGYSSLGTPIVGGAVVIDVNSGEVLSMVSMPTFDLNRFFDEDVLRELRPHSFDPNVPESTRTAERNLALSNNYQSGSTIKPTNILGGLEYGVIDRNTSVYVTLDTKYQPENENDPWNSGWDGGPSDIHVTGDINPITAIKRSSNYFPIKVVEILGSERAIDWLKMAGFGRRILAWPDELTADRAWGSFHETAGYLAPIGQTYPSVRNLRYVGIGRGPVSCSILQIANSMATICRDGVFLPPTIIKSPSVLRKEYRVASQGNIDIVKEGMYEVVNNLGGTAYEYIYPLPWEPEEVKIYGKTGTTDFTLFGCFAEAFDGRKIAVAVAAEVRNSTGGATAAPLAIDILVECSRFGYLPEN